MSFEIQTTEYGEISASFSQASLAKLCVEKIGVQTGPFGSQLHNEDYVVIGTPIITVEHLGENRITYQNMPYVSDEDKTRLSKYCLQEGDIVFSRVGSVDRRALVRQEEDGWLFSGRCLRVRVDKTKIDPVYLSYFFGLEGFKNYIKSIAVGATMPSINTKILSDVPIYFPELENQTKMGKILKEFDDKIELNHQINQTLEAMAQAIFKSWFVDFEPVKAKIAAIEAGEDAEGVTRAAMSAISGKTDDELDKMQAEQSDEYTQLEETAKLFPAAMWDSELGEVPEGWKIGCVGDITEKIFSGGTPNTKTEAYWNGELNWFSSGETRNVVIIDTEKRITEKGAKESSTKLAIYGDILIASAGQGHTRGQTSFCAIDTFINQSVVSIRAKDIRLSSWLFFDLSRRYEEMRSISDSHSSRGSLTTKLLSNLSIIIPPESLYKKYGKIADQCLINIAENMRQAETLSQLRDILLPKLLSGELSVNATSVEEVDV